MAIQNAFGEYRNWPLTCRSRVRDVVCQRAGDTVQARQGMGRQGMGRQGMGRQG